MSKKILSRIAATILATGLATTGVVAGISGPASAAWGDGHRHRTPIVQPVDEPADPGTGGATTQRYDTGWG